MKIVWEKDEQELKNVFKSYCASIGKTMSEVLTELIKTITLK